MSPRVVLRTPARSDEEEFITQMRASRRLHDARERRIIRAGMSRPFAAAARMVAYSAGVKDPEIRWRLAGGGPWFDNQVASLLIDGREMRMRLDKAVPVDSGEARLERVLDRRLA